MSVVEHSTFLIVFIRENYGVATSVELAATGPVMSVRTCYRAERVPSSPHEGRIDAQPYVDRLRVLDVRGEACVSPSSSGCPLGIASLASYLNW